MLLRRQEPSRAKRRSRAGLDPCLRSGTQQAPTDVCKRSIANVVGVSIFAAMMWHRIFPALALCLSACIETEPLLVRVNTVGDAIFFTKADGPQDCFEYIAIYRLRGEGAFEGKQAIWAAQKSDPTFCAREVSAPTAPRYFRVTLPSERFSPGYYQAVARIGNKDAETTFKISDGM